MVNVEVWPNISDQGNPHLLNTYKCIIESKKFDLDYLSVRSFYRFPHVIHIHWPEYFFSGGISREIDYVSHILVVNLQTEN